MDYGTNLITHKPIEIDRTKLVNPHKAIFGVAGSGTNTLMKREMMEVQKTHPDDCIIWVDFYNEFFAYGESLQNYSVFRMNEMMKWDTELDKVVIAPTDNFNVVTLYNVEGDKLKEAKKRVIQILWNTMETMKVFREQNRRFWIFIDSISMFLEDKETAELMWNLFKRARTANCILTFTEGSFLPFSSREYGLQILGNTSCITFLRQYRNDCDVIQNHFYVPDVNFLVNAPAGSGLIYLNGEDVFVPFRCETQAGTTASSDNTPTE